ncbi:hypothetical protein GCM10022408_29390 [Hymenobacter fastidiosus]|uniref:Gliding motility-associated C-terminal domain-containing protein n=1 Tax=Hymenobacter fastidiosus TaxID=486264 RepID=A0ABP7SNX5_9BACT
MLVFAWGWLGLGTPQAVASHIQGGQLTYQALGANQYKVTLAVFRDCGGSSFASIRPELEYRTTGCQGGPWPKERLTLVAGSQRIGDPYCATGPFGASPCGVGRPTNFETGLFEAVVTLPPAPEWTLSVTLGARPKLGNVDVGSELCYFEATLNNLIGGQAIENTAPQNDPLNAVIPFVCWRQDTQLSFATTEPDGDSLVYSLGRSLENCGDTTTYLPYTASRAIDLTPKGSTSFCAAFIPPGVSLLFRPTFPIASFAYSGSCPTKTATPNFLFNPTLGTITFTPAFFRPGINMAENKYAVVGTITEWRRVRKANGTTTAYKVGSVRRDILVIVIDCNANLTPAPPVATGAPKTSVRIASSRDSTFITAYSCNYTEVRLKFTDPNPADKLTVTYPELDPATPSLLTPAYLPAGVATFRVVANETSTPTGILKIRPDAAFVGRTFRIPVKIEDNSCPIKGITYRTIVLRIAAGNFARATASAPVIYAGSGAAVTLSATPFRPDSVGASPAQYGYRWTAANGLNPADSTRPTLTVRPTQTTRYQVRVLGLSFPAGLCQDTASVLVKVVVPDGKVPNIFTPNGDGLNETFVIPINPPGSRLQIFNRWGRKVRDYIDYANDWTGDDQPAGIYFYRLTDHSGGQSKGWVQLAR